MCFTVIIFSNIQPITNLISKTACKGYVQNGYKWLVRYFRSLTQPITSTTKEARRDVHLSTSLNSVKANIEKRRRFSLFTLFICTMFSLVFLKKFYLYDLHLCVTQGNKMTKICKLVSRFPMRCHIILFKKESTTYLILFW